MASIYGTERYLEQALLDIEKTLNEYQIDDSEINLIFTAVDINHNGNVLKAETEGLSLIFVGEYEVDCLI